MTKPRPPLSIEQAIVDVIDAIGMPRAIEVTGRKAHYLSRVSDPDKRGLLTCADALLLDQEYDATVGGRPIMEMMMRMADVSRAETAACAQLLLAATIESVKEAGDAHAALLQVTAPGATPATKTRALRELLQSIAALKRCAPILNTMIRRSAQPRVRRHDRGPTEARPRLSRRRRGPRG